MKGNIKKNLEWFPDCWVTFLMMGRGCEDGKVSQLFTGGIPAKDSAQVLGPNEVITRLGSKSARKAYYTQINSSTPTTASNGSSMQQRKKKRKIVTPDFSVCSSVSSAEKERKSLSARLALLREKVSIIESIDEPIQKILIVKREMLDIIDRIANELDKSYVSSTLISPFEIEEEETVIQILLKYLRLEKYLLLLQVAIAL